MLLCWWEPWEGLSHADIICQSDLWECQGRWQTGLVALTYWPVTMPQVPRSCDMASVLLRPALWRVLFALGLSRILVL